MLSPLAYLYGKIVDVRNRLYDKGVFETFDLGARTISVGNITTGGTGKTPLVAHIAGILADRGEKVCVLTRGYGRQDPRRRVLVSDGISILADAAVGGDEPVELAHKLLEKHVIVIADADRVAAAEWAKRKFAVTAFVLDDGFQHRRARRDVDIVCIDATSPFGGNRMLPAGRLREPLKNLARADAVVITRADLGDDISNLRSQILSLAPNAVILEGRDRIRGVASIEEFRTAAVPRTSINDALKALRLSRERELSVAAFCALGNPDAFFNRLLAELERGGEERDLDLCLARAFPDHHAYSQADINELQGSATDVLITTGKDAVKLSEIKFEIPCFVVEIEVELDGENEFAALL
jgi:tetraacyldisaccharide 4'-kinase